MGASQGCSMDVDLLRTNCPSWTGYVLFQNQSSIDALNMDTVCRLYEVGRQRLAEDEDEEEDQVSGLCDFFLLNRFLEALLFCFCCRGFLRSAFATCWHILTKGSSCVLDY